MKMLKPFVSDLGGIAQCNSPSFCTRSKSDTSSLAMICSIENSQLKIYWLYYSFKLGNINFRIQSMSLEPPNSFKHEIEENTLHLMLDIEHNKYWAI